MNRFLRPCLALLFVLGVMATAVTATFAQIERQISYQGLLTLPNGLPLDDGQYDLVMRMYDAPSGGNLLWEETQQTILSKGLFNVYLGAVVPLNGVDFFNTQVYLETALAGQPPFPRTRLAVVPYAVRAERAGIADSINIAATGFVRSLNGAEGNLIINGRNGVAVTRNGDTIHVESTITFTGITNLSSPQNTIEIVNPNGPNTTVDVRDGAITTAKIADSVITTAKLVDSLITTVKIADGAVTASKIGPGVIPTSLPPSGPAGGDLTGTYPNPTIALGAVTGPKIADGAVSTFKISDGAVTTQKISDNSIVTTKVVDGAITSPKLSGTGVTAGTYGDNLNIPRITVDDKGRVTLITVQPLTNFPFIVAAGGDLTGTYPDPLIRTNAVTTSKILDFNVTTSKIADLAITTGKIAIGAVRSEQVADGSLTVIDLAPGTIPTTLPPSGPASGDLAGFYPSPILSTSAGAGSRMVDALRSNFVSGDPEVNTANNIVMLNALGQFPAANGTLINNLNVNNVGSGVLAIQFGGTNSSTPLNNNRVMVSSGGRIVEAPQQGAGQLLIGTGTTTAPAVGNIVAGTGMTVTYASPNIIIASTTQPGTANDQTLRWDAAANAWVPSSNVLSSAGGNLTVNGNTVLGDAAVDAVRMNGSTVAIPNVPTSTASSNVVVRNPVSGNLEVSTAIYSTSTLPLSPNTAIRTNAAAQLESVALTNGQILIGSAGVAPQAATITGTANRVIVTNGAGSITLSTPQDIATTSNVNFNSVTTANNAFIGTSLNVGGAATVGGTLAVTGATTLNSTLTQNGVGQVTFGGNVNANSGVDVIGLTTMNGALTQSGGQVTFSGNVDALGGLDVAGLTTMSGAITQTGTGQVTFGGNVDANNGLDVTGATTLAGNVTQTGGTVTIGGATTVNNSLTQSGGQVTFNGNVDATSGLDVTGSNLTVGGANFTVSPTTGNTATAGTLSANGAVTFNSTLNVAGSTTLNGNVVAGDGNGDNVTINTTAGVLRMQGLPNVAGADVLMIGAANDVSRFPITGLVGADEGLTYNEGGSAKVRLGSTTTTASTMTGNRFVNMGNNDLRFTTNGGNSTVLWLDGDATNFGVDLFAAGTGAIDLNGTTRIVGATTVTGSVTQSGGQVTMGGNVDANSGLDVLGGNLTVGGTNFVVSPTTGNTSTAGTLSANGAVTFSSTMNVSGTSTLSGNVVAGDGTGDNVTINTAGGGALTMVGLPVAQGVDVLMANGANIVTRTPLAAILNADNGITYNEAGLGLVRLGSTTNLGSPLTANRFVNLGNNDLTFTTNNGAANLVVLNGDAANYGVTINAAGTSSIALNGTTNITGPTNATGSVTQSGGQVTFNGNVDANAGLDVVGPTTMSGNVTQSTGTVTLNGATTVNNTFTQTGTTNQVTFNGNVDAKNGLDVTGLTTMTGAVTQSGGLASFGGNVDATAGLDVTGQDLTVGGANFTVNPGTGNTSVNGTLNVNGATTLNGNVNLGNATSDNVVIDVSGGAGTLRVNGLATAAGTDLLMINATNIVSRAPLANLIDADQGVTYNEAGSGKMRLGSTTNAGVPFTANRFINLGNNDLTITTNNGAQNLLVFDGDAVNAGVTVAPSGTGRFVVNGGTSLNGSVIMTNTITQQGPGQVSFSGNVDATSGLDVTGANLTVGGTLFTVAPASGNTAIGGTLGVTGATTLSSTLAVTGNTALNGNVTAGNGNGDDVTIDVSGAGGELTINGLPVAAGTDVLMSNGANVITKTPLIAIIDANQGITYNEDGTGKVRLGGTTNAINPFQVDRYVNLGNFDLFFTTSGGANNVLRLDGGALNYGATINAGGTGSIALTGPTNITGVTTVTGNTTVTGTMTQNGGGQVTLTGNVDANNGLDVVGAFTVNGASTLTGNLVQQTGTVNLGGATTIGGATSINNTLNVSGATTLSSSLTVNGNTTLGDAAADNLTVNAATVTMANLPTSTTVNKFIMSGTGGALQVREINNIVTGTGTPNRLTRWDATGAGILDASLSDDGVGNLSRSGNIAINPGAAFTLSTNGNLSVNGASTLTGTTSMNGAVNVGNGGDAVAVNVTGSQLTVAGLATAVGTDVLMANASNVVSRTPITSLINADQGLTYNEAGSAMVRLGSATRGTSTISANRFIDVGTTSRLTFTTNAAGADDLLVLTGGTGSYGVTMRSKGIGTIGLKAGTVNLAGDVTAGSFVNLNPSAGAEFKIVDATQEVGVTLDPADKEIILLADDISGGSFGELRVKSTGVEISGTIYQATPDLVQFSGDVEMAQKLDVVGNFAVFADRFTVNAATGNTSVKGTFSANGSVNLGDGIGNDAVVANVTGSTLQMIGLGTTPGTDLLMINGTNVVSRTPLTSILGADEGLTYDEAGSGKVRLGSTSRTTSTLTGNRFINLGNSTLTVTTGNGTPDLLVLSSGAATINGAVNMTGNTTIGDAAADALTINAGNITANNIPVGTTSTFVTLSGTTVQQRTINNIVTGTGTPNRMTRWLTSSTIGDASLDDDGAGTLSRSGNIAINPGAANAITTNGRLNVSGATTLSSTLNVTGLSTLAGLTANGTTNLNGSVTLGNGDADAIVVNSTTGLALNTGAGADMFITESSISRSGNIQLNPGAGNTVSTDGNLTVDGNAIVRGSTLLGDASTDQFTVIGITNINTGGSTASTSIGNATGAFSLTSSNLNISSTGVISDATGAVEINDDLTVSGATTLSSSLAVTGTTNLNGAVNLGNGDADAITVNSTNGLVVNTGAAADMTITESAITRAGNIAVNTGAANTVTMNGSLSVDANATIKGNSTIGDQTTDVVNITGQTTILGGTSINTTPGFSTSIGNTGSQLNLTGSQVALNGPVSQSGGDVLFKPGTGNSFTVTTDGATADGMTFSMLPSFQTMLMSVEGSAAGQDNSVTITPSNVLISSSNTATSASAQVETKLNGDVNVTATGLTTITGATRIVGAASINSSLGDPSTSIGNASSVVNIVGSTVSVNAGANGGNTAIGNNGANSSTVTISGGAANGNIVMNGVATDANPTELLTINNANQVRRTPLSGTARQGVIFTDGQYRLGGTTATEVPFLVSRFINIDNNNLSVTANAGANTPLLVTGGANSGVTLRASGGSGQVNVLGTTNINTTGGSGSTSIGNSSNQLSMSGSTVDVTGTATINTTNAASTSIGNATGALNLRGSAVSVTGNMTANNDVTVTGTTTLNGTSNVNGTANLNGAINLGNGDADAITVNTGGAANMTISETGLTRVGNIAINPGSGNSVTTDGNLSVSGNASVTGNTTVTGTTNLNGTSNFNGAVNIGNGDADAIAINTTGSFTLTSPNLTITAAGVISNAGGTVTIADDLSVNGTTTLTGTTNINTTGASATSIGNSTNGGAVSVSSAGANNITINPGGDLVLSSIDADNVPTQMLTLTVGGQVRRTDMSGTAEQGVIYTGGKYMLGGANSTEVPLTSDRFVNVNDKTLNFTSNAGTVMSVNGSTLTMPLNATVLGNTTLGNSSTLDAVNINAVTTINGATIINGTVSQSSGSVQLNVSGAGNSMTIGGLSPTGTFTDDVMLITTGTNIVRRRSLADLISANQGVSYNETSSDGQVRLGGSANNKSLFASNRFINQRDFALNFTYTDGIAAPTTMLSLDEGAVTIDATTFKVTGGTEINATGASATTIGNGNANLNLTGSIVETQGQFKQSGGAVEFRPGALASFNVLVNSTVPDGLSFSMDPAFSTISLSSAGTGAGESNSLEAEPTTIRLISTDGLNTGIVETDITGNVDVSATGTITLAGTTAINTAIGAGATTIGNASDNFALASNNLNISATGTISDIGVDNGGAVFVDDDFRVSGASGFDGDVRIGAAGASNITLNASAGNILTEGNLQVKGNTLLGNQPTDLIDINGKTTIIGETTVRGENILIETTGPSPKTSITMNNNAASFAWEEGATKERVLSMDVDGIIISANASGVGASEIEINDGSILMKGNTLINATGNGSTTIGSTTTGGAVSIRSSGANNITMNPGGDLVLLNIDSDAAPTQMLTLTSGGNVRKTTLSGTADQGVIYTNGKYQLGGATATEVPFTTDRFINISNSNLNFTTSAGTLMNMTGSTVTLTGNMTQSAGNVSFTPGVGKTFTVAGTTTINGITDVNGNTTINTTNGDGTTSIGNTGQALTMSGSTVGITGTTTVSGATTIIGVTDVNGNTTINTTNGDGTTSIGNTGQALTMSGSTVGITGTTTVSGATTINGVTDVNGNTTINTTNGDGTTSIGNTGQALTMSGSTVGITGTTTVSGATTISGVTDVNGNTTINTTNGDGTTSIGNTGQSLTLTGNTVGVNGATTITGATTVTGTTLINTIGSAPTTIGSTDAGGSVAVLSSGANNITMNPGGDLVLLNIDSDAAPTQMLTLTSGGTVRKTTLSGTADQGVIYTNGKYLLGGATATEVPFTSDRFINISNSNLNFTTSAGTLVNMTGSTVTLTGNMTQSAGNVSFTPGVGKTFTVAGTTTINGITDVNGNTTINTTNGDGTTSIGNTTQSLTLSGSTVGITGATTVTGATDVNGNTTINTTNGDGTTSIGNSGQSLTMTGSTIGLNGATTITGTTEINTSGAGATTIGSTATGGAVAIRSSGANNVSINPGGDLILQSIDTDAAPTEMLTLVNATGAVRRTVMSGTADQGVSYTSGKYQLGSTTSSGVPLTQNRFVNASDFTLDFTYNDAGTPRSMFRLNDGEVVVTAPNTFKVVGPSSIIGNTQINTTAGDGSTQIGNTTGSFTLRSTDLNVSSFGVISDQNGDVEVNDNLNVALALTVTGTTNLNGAANIGNGDADAVAINTTGNFSLASSALNVSTSGTITDAGTDNGGAVFVDDLLLVSGATTIDDDLTVTGQFKGAGTERLHTAAASNRYAERVKINGDGNFRYSVANSQFGANSVIIITVEDYTGPGILAHQIKRTKDGGGNVIPGTIDIYFSQPILGGESVVVNVMVVNQ